MRKPLLIAAKLVLGTAVGGFAAAALGRTTFMLLFYKSSSPDYRDIAAGTATWYMMILGAGYGATVTTWSRIRLIHAFGMIGLVLAGIAFLGLVAEATPSEIGVFWVVAVIGLAPGKRQR